MTVLAVPALSQQKAQESTPKYRDPSLAIDDRVADLRARMTLEEKVQQITGGGRGEMEVIDPTGTFTTETARAMFQSSLTGSRCLTEPRARSTVQPRGSTTGRSKEEWTARKMLL